MYASRRYNSGDAITVYVGTDIGAADGREDDYAAYKINESAAAPWTDNQGNQHQGNGGRHVMQIGTRLIDGQRDGYTGAHYANSAYQVPIRWTNKAELKAGGTIRVMKNKTIYEGEEILFAYHADYWKRWGMSKKRGRRPRPQTTQDDGNTNAKHGHDNGTYAIVTVDHTQVQLPQDMDGDERTTAVATETIMSQVRPRGKITAEQTHTEDIGVRVVVVEQGHQGEGRARGRPRKKRIELGAS